MNNTSELQLQGQCFQWAWNTLPATRRLLFHVPNGGHRSKVEASWLKSSGVIPGIPDLLFIWKGRTHAFELKSEKGTLFDKQVQIHVLWDIHGVPVYLIRSLEQFKYIFLSIINQTQ